MLLKDYVCDTCGIPEELDSKKCGDKTICLLCPDGMLIAQISAVRTVFKGTGWPDKDGH